MTLVSVSQSQLLALCLSKGQSSLANFGQEDIRSKNVAGGISSKKATGCFANECLSALAHVQYDRFHCHSLVEPPPNGVNDFYTLLQHSSKTS